MKKSDKVAVVISIIAIIGVAVFLFRTGLLENMMLLIVFLVIVIGAPVLLLLNQLILYLSARSRLRRFGEFSKQFGLTHESHSPTFFTTYGSFNSLFGTINGHSISIKDQIVDPNSMIELKKFAKSMLGTMALTTLLTGGRVTSYGSAFYTNRSTKVNVDSKEFIISNPVYVVSPWMALSDIKSLLDLLKQAKPGQIEECLSVL